MATTTTQPVYVECRQGGHWIRGSRVSLDSVVHAYRAGASPESIAQGFPSLSLEEVYGAITFYLHRRAEIDAHLQEQEHLFESFQEGIPEQNTVLFRSLLRSQQKQPHDP